MSESKVPLSRNAGSNRARRALRRESAKYHKVRVQVFTNVEHGRAAEFRRAEQAVAFQFGKPAGVRIYLFSGCRQPLDG